MAHLVAVTIFAALKCRLDNALSWLDPKLEQVLGTNERARHLRAACIIGIFVASLFSIFNLLTPGMLLLGMTELAVVLLLLVPALAISGTAHGLKFSESLLLLATALIFGALIVFGGIEGTGLFWVYTVPFLAFFLKGQRRGWLYSLLFMAGAAFYLVGVAPALAFSYPYSPVVATHFLLSLGFYILVAAAFNHVRSRFEAQLQQGKEQAEAAVHAKSRFLAAASHDLRQPAHALGMFVARLMQLPHEPQTKELVAGVDASVRALQEMLDAFFDYSRLDAQSMQVRLCAFPVDSIFEPLRRSFSGLAAQKGLRLRIRPSGAWVHSDSILLQRVMLNLVSNAMQYTQQGSILVSCRAIAGGTQARIQVWDSGIGIAPQNHERVFQEFFQAENPARDRNKGMGLGLSMVQRSCRLLNHPLAMRSGLGRGTRFTLTIPLAQTRLARSPAATVDLPALEQLDGMHVMLIEDDALGSAALAGLLTSWGCLVTVAGSAQIACDRLGHVATPDFIVSDYRLPGAHDGIAAVRMVRQAAGREIAACLISGDTQGDLSQQARALGLTLLQKPVRPAKLRSLLRRSVQVGALDATDAGGDPRREIGAASV